MTTPSRISITICGDGGCGKSSITLRLVRSAWTSEYDPTIEDSYSVTRTIAGVDYLLSLTDTAGQEEYRGLISSSSMSSDAFLLVYDITNPASLHEQLPYFLDMVQQERETRAEGISRGAGGSGSGAGSKGLPTSGGEWATVEPVVIVAANKCDLKEQRRVSARDGLEWARARGCGFMETSARECVNVEETFALIVRRVVAAREAHRLALMAPKSSRAKTGGTPGVVAGAAGSTLLPGQPGTHPDSRAMGARAEKGWEGRAGDGLDGLDDGQKNKKGWWSFMKCWR